jgi:23S rRNA (cytosine1962-C5)-methyltransferase
MTSAPPASQLLVLASDGFPDYRFIDSGQGRRLERFGRVTVDRPEPQAMWTRRQPKAWETADAVFGDDAEADEGKWRIPRTVPQSWPVKVGDVTMQCRLSVFRHLGLFPEQRPNWDWMRKGIEKIGGRPRVLNLFAYTGCASLIAAKAGAEVTHVDASRKAIAWAKDNQAASGLDDAPIRWILEDARKFVAREVRRGKTYDVILVDPPKFGRGPGNEVWEIARDLPLLMADCAALLSKKQSFLILTAYAIRASALAIGEVAREALAERGGRFDVGELAIKEHGGTRLLSTSLFTRWCSDDLTF